MPQAAVGRPTSRKSEWGLNPQSRKWVVVLHAICGIGWMGVDIALILLLWNARVTSSATEAIGGYAAVSLIVLEAVPPLCFGVLATGLLLGWGTAWGVLRHWWVVIKLVLSIVMTVLVFVLLVPAMRNMPALVDVSTATAVRERLGALTTQLFFPPGVSFALLGVSTVLSIFKPKGLTPWNTERSR